MFGDHGLCGLLKEGAHGKSPKCLGGNLGDFGEFCKGLSQLTNEFPKEIMESEEKYNKLIEKLSALDLKKVEILEKLGVLP